MVEALTNWKSPVLGLSLLFSNLELAGCFNWRWPPKLGALKLAGASARMLQTIKHSHDADY